jgi:(p)ppGpp synthase/HD superfamily hydrolase
MTTDNEKIVAYLHDIIEDTEIDFKFIDSEFGFVIAEAVEILTKKPGDLYIDYICRISGNMIARKVKIADLEDNMNISRLYKVTEHDIERLNKYIQAYKYLTNETK